MPGERMPQPLPPMPLCPRCGVIAPGQQSACLVCSEPFTTPRTTVRPTPAHAWVALRCSFQCRSCQFLSPLDELDIDGSVECAQCGQSQRFDVDAWHEALAFAHAVGDLAYPLPEGRLAHPTIWIGGDNPFTAIGHTTVFDEHRQTSVQVVDGLTVHRSLFIEAAPGHPVCDACQHPLELEFDREGVSANCRECGSQSGYRLPEGAQRFCPAVAGVVAEAHRGDRRRARMESTADGPLALKCPECGGALAASRERILRCSYCGTASLIPSQARVREVGQVLTPDVWWLAFRGPSARRMALETPAMEDPGEAKNDETHLEQADEVPGLHSPQLMINLVLPAAALVVAIVVYLAIEAAAPGTLSDLF